MTTVVTVFGNSGIMQEVMLFIQTMTNSSAYNQLVQIFLVIGLALATFKGSMEHQFQHRTTVVHFLVVATLVYGFYIPKATVILNDQINGAIAGTTSYQVPTGIAYTMHFGSEIETGLVSLTNSATALPPAEQYGTTTYSWGPQALVAMPSVSIQDNYPYLFATVNDFFAQCVITGVLLHKINQAKLYNTQDLLDFINPARYNMPGAYTSLVYSSTKNVGESCQDVYIYIKSHLLALQTADIPDQYKRVILSKTALDGNPTKIAGYLGTVGNNLLGGSLTGEQMLMQNIMAKSMEKGIQSFAMTYSTNPNLLAYTTTNALDKAVTSMTTSAYLAKQFLPWLHIIIEAIVYATMPLAFFMMLLPQLTKKVVFTYVTLVLWLALWGPIMAIINDIVYVHGHQVMSQFQGVLSLATYPEIVTQAGALQAMAGSMLWFVPIIAFSMASLSTYGFTSLASGIGGTLHSAGMAAGGSVSGITGRQALTDSLNKGVEEHTYDSGETAAYLKENDRGRAWEANGHSMGLMTIGQRDAAAAARGKTLSNAATGVASSGVGYSGLKTSAAEHAGTSLGTAQTAVTRANDFLKAEGSNQRFAKTEQGVIQASAFLANAKSRAGGMMSKKSATISKLDPKTGKQFDVRGDLIQNVGNGAGTGGGKTNIQTESYAVTKGNVDQLKDYFSALSPDMAKDIKAGSFVTETDVAGENGKLTPSTVSIKRGGSAEYDDRTYTMVGNKWADEQGGHLSYTGNAGEDRSGELGTKKTAQLERFYLKAGEFKGDIQQHGGESVATGIVGAKGIQSMINNRKAYGFSNGEVQMLKEDEKLTKEGKLGGISASITATNKGIAMTRVSAGSDTQFKQTANTDKTTTANSGFSGTQNISKNNPVDVQVGSSKQDWVELTNGSVVKAGDQLQTTSTLSPHQEGNLANRLQIVDDKRGQKGEKPLYTNVISALRQADTAGRSADITMVTTDGRVGSLLVNSGGKMTTTDTSVAEETNSKLFGTNVSFGGVKTATKDLLENNYAKDKDGQLTVAGHEARMQDTQILSNAIQNIDNIGDAKTKQVARNEFAATVSETVSGYSNESYGKKTIPVKLFPEA